MQARRLTQLLSVLLAMLLVASCSRPSDTDGSDGGGGEDKVVEIGATVEPAGMDMITVDGAGTPFVLLYNVYETLVKMGEDREVQPLLATEWQISDDRLTYTFNLDPQAKFADGSPVTSDAVVKSFQRIIDGEGIGSVKADFAPLKAVHAVDEHTVELKLSKPSNFFLLALTGRGGVIVNPKADTKSLTETPAGSGPYTLGEWEPGSLVQLVRNEQYWGTPPHFDEANFRFYADPNAMNTAMLNGQLDIISNLTVPQSLGQFQDKERFTILEGYTDGEVVLTMNHKTPALAKREVRQAINHAIDRKAVVQSAWGGKGELIGSMVPPTDPWYEDLSDTYPHDPAKAKELLAKAGHASGLTLRLRVPTIPYATAAARSIQSQLGEVGITVKIEELEFARWLDLVFTKHDYDMTIVAHVEPRDLGMYARKGYYTGYDNPAFDKLMTEAAEGTEEEFVSKQKEAARLLAEDAAADWLFLLPNLIITKPDISGVQADQLSVAFDVTTIASSR
ncbi:ABC transporter substrate-binding protein [uncultured Tessaracoccus sp.]|uniref:ABC transporter substrate-binding protein n=1 Tax=uncultured Tessaracoccus sp. TaxID=905023 RepID=UPI0025F4392B|nr:ABC transporter substrate-binding protein [uncultured Tessaracoccus sp.]